MIYNGTKLDWHGHGLFNATSGLPGHQTAAEQDVVDHGPIPEGTYSFPLMFTRDAEMVKEGQLDTREGVESLPDHWDFHRRSRDRAGHRHDDVIRIDNNAWGPDRVRLTIIHIDDPKCRKRSGFYIHDSTKGFSHGCVEVDPEFFVRLRAFIKLPPRRRGNKSVLILKVEYPSPTASTNGGTKKP
jgi:hypothetical protein